MTDTLTNVVALIRRFYLFVIGMLRTESDTIPAAPQSVHPIRQKKPKEESEDELRWGAFFFKGAILDQLDEYFWCVRRMKAADPNAYALYSKVGAYLLPDHPSFGLLAHSELLPSFAKERPSFGAVAFGIDKEQIDAEKRGTANSWVPRFVWFTKWNPSKAPKSVQRTNFGDVYVCTVYWDAHDKEIKRGAPTEFAVAVSPKGEVSVLRTKIRHVSVVKHKRRHHGPYESTLVHRHWGHDDFFKSWAKEKGITVEEHLRRVFIMTANAFEEAQSDMVRINIEKRRMLAVFHVNIKRMPYFFKDRNIIVNERGSKKRIFHIVRPHVRATGAQVKMHFRGLREFIWNGYQVKVTVPGWHHADTRQLTASAQSYDDGEHIPDGMLEAEKLGAIVRDRILDKPIPKPNQRTTSRPVCN